MVEPIPIENLDERTLKRYGIELPPSLADIGTNLIVLGRVFSAIKGLSDDEALEVLKQAQMYIITKKQAANLESLGLPGNGLGQDYAPPIDWTLKVVAKVYKLKSQDLKQRRRDSVYAEARQVAMYVLCMTTKYSLTDIGRAIGARSPSTVSHALDRISRRIKEDEKLKAKVEEIQNLIGGK